MVEYASHFCLKTLNYYHQHKIVTLLVRNFLQSLDGTMYKPLDCNYYQEAATYVHNNPQASTNESNFGRSFSASWNKSETLVNALKGLTYTGLYLYSSRAVSDDNPFPPSESCNPWYSTSTSNRNSVTGFSWTVPCWNTYCFISPGAMPVESWNRKTVLFCEIIPNAEKHEKAWYKVGTPSFGIRVKFWGTYK
jgi:hypothetical protein